jgi:hypothetical protein
MMLSKWPLQLPADAHTDTTDVNGEWQQRISNERRCLLMTRERVSRLSVSCCRNGYCPVSFFPAVQHDNIFREEEEAKYKEMLGKKK